MKSSDLSAARQDRVPLYDGGKAATVVYVAEEWYDMDIIVGAALSRE